MAVPVAVGVIAVVGVVSFRHVFLEPRLQVFNAAGLEFGRRERAGCARVENGENPVRKAAVGDEAPALPLDSDEEVGGASTQTILPGDAREVLSEFEPESFDFIVTSPPYWRILTKKGGEKSEENK